MNHTADDVMDAALLAQQRWTHNHISRFELVGDFLETLVPVDSYEKEKLERVLPKIQILVTTTENGVEILQATNRDELLDLMIKTTWIPAVTGSGFLSDHKDMYLDGGFSRYLHPQCEYQLELPVVWETLVHTFTPSLTRETIQQLWQAGYEFDYGFQGLNKREQPMLYKDQCGLHNDSQPLCNSAIVDSVQLSTLL